MIVSTDSARSTRCFSTAEAMGTGTATDSRVAEIVNFRLKAEVSEAEFLAAARATAALVQAQPGFLRRHLSRDESGVWTDFVEWVDLATAHQAAAVVVTDAAFAPFGAMISPEGLTMRHSVIRWSMGD